MVEPTSPRGSGKPDETLLEELARAFEPDEATADGQPAGEVPADEAPADEATADGQPADEVPADEVPADEAPADEATADGQPAGEVPADEASADEATADGQPAGEVPADEASAGESEPEPGDARVIPIARTPGMVGGGMVGEPTVARRTILIGDGDDIDEQPDAVYLDDQLARDDDSKGTVFIEDDGLGDAIAPMDAAQPGIEPRIRQRRIGVRRAASRRRLKWLVIVAVVVLVVVGGLALLGSPLFKIETVRVTGAVYTDSLVLDEVVDDLQGRAVLLVDTGAAEDRLEAIPWVESARVRTKFPDQATIELRERTPLVAMQGLDGMFRVLDREGRVLDSIEGQPVAMVLIAGPGTLDVEPGGFAPIGHASAASLVTKLTPNIRGRVEAILVTPDGGDLRLIVSNGDNPSIEVEFGSALGDNEQLEKLVRLERVLEDIGNDPVLVINVSTSDVTVQ